MNNDKNYEFSPSARSDFDSLDGSIKTQVLKVVRRVATKPFSQSEGGYGKPLGNIGGNDLTGLLKIKLKKSGIRIVYRIVQENDKMRIIVIAARVDDEVYTLAAKRMQSE
ncbi:hypothetical protein FACS1894111_08160 [Clostridia bacterium]|nr:hypothetical protein FACS1894111_08160 [Clostridia bacterium]